MEFNEKLQELRKQKGLTQEELADALFVSRTAVSKWESGRGYPSIDSLKELSRFFSVSIDELICPQEIVYAAENDKKEFVGKYVSLICAILDILTALLLFLPIFGNKSSAQAVMLFDITGTQLWVKAVFIIVIAFTVLNGVCSAVICNFNKPLWNRHRLVTGMALSFVGTAVFVLTRQPYAGIIFFILLVIKGVILFFTKQSAQIWRR